MSNIIEVIGFVMIAVALLALSPWLLMAFIGVMLVLVAYAMSDKT